MKLRSGLAFNFVSKEWPRRRVEPYRTSPAVLSRLDEVGRHVCTISREFEFYPDCVLLMITDRCFTSRIALFVYATKYVLHGNTYTSLKEVLKAIQFGV